jgi:ketosteroid isomerase-like protein
MVEDEHGSANVRFVHEWMEAFNDGNMDWLTDGTDPDVEWVVTREHPTTTTHRGIEAIRAYLEDWRETMPGMRFEPASIEAYGEKVLTVGEVTATGAGSGLGIGVTMAFVSTYRDGRLLRLEEFLDSAEAERVVKSGD